MQFLPSIYEYGGPSTSSTAQDVTARKECILPLDVGYNTDVSQGDVKTLSTSNLANLTAWKNRHKMS